MNDNDIIRRIDGAIDELVAIKTELQRSSDEPKSGLNKSLRGKISSGDDGQLKRVYEKPSKDVSSRDEIQRESKDNSFSGVGPMNDSEYTGRSYAQQYRNARKEGTSILEDAVDSFSDFAPAPLKFAKGLGDFANKMKDRVKSEDSWLGKVKSRMDDYSKLQVALIILSSVMVLVPLTLLVVNLVKYIPSVVWYWLIYVIVWAVMYGGFRLREFYDIKFVRAIPYVAFLAASINAASLRVDGHCAISCLAVIASFILLSLMGVAVYVPTHSRYRKYLVGATYYGALSIVAHRLISELFLRITIEVDDFVIPVYKNTVENHAICNALFVVFVGIMGCALIPVALSYGKNQKSTRDMLIKMRLDADTGSKWMHKKMNEACPAWIWMSSCFIFSNATALMQVFSRYDMGKILNFEMRSELANILGFIFVGLSSIVLCTVLRKVSKDCTYRISDLIFDKLDKECYEGKSRWFGSRTVELAIKNVVYYFSAIVCFGGYVIEACLTENHYGYWQDGTQFVCTLSGPVIALALIGISLAMMDKVKKTLLLQPVLTVVLITSLLRTNIKLTTMIGVSIAVIMLVEFVVVSLGMTWVQRKWELDHYGVYSSYIRKADVEKFSLNYQDRYEHINPNECMWLNSLRIVCIAMLGIGVLEACSMDLAVSAATLLVARLMFSDRKVCEYFVKETEAYSFVHTAVSIWLDVFSIICFVAIKSWVLLTCYVVVKALTSLTDVRIGETTESKVLGAIGKTCMLIATLIVLDKAVWFVKVMLIAYWILNAIGVLDSHLKSGVVNSTSILEKEYRSATWYNRMGVITSVYLIIECVYKLVKQNILVAAVPDMTNGLRSCIGYFVALLCIIGVTLIYHFMIYKKRVILTAVDKQKESNLTQAEIDAVKTHREFEFNRRLIFIISIYILGVWTILRSIALSLTSGSAGFAGLIVAVLTGAAVFGVGVWYTIVIAKKETA